MLAGTIAAASSSSSPVGLIAHMLSVLVSAEEMQKKEKEIRAYEKQLPPNARACLEMREE